MTSRPTSGEPRAESVVVDASIIVPLLANADGRSRAAQAAVAHRHLIEPQHLYLEVTNVLRRLWLRGSVDDEAARVALDALTLLHIEVWPWDLLAARVWELRENLTAYDAADVALAEWLRVPLVTADGRLAGAPGIRCPVIVV